MLRAMNVAVRLPSMTQDEFLDWVQRQEGRHEFDGYRPVAMTGGTRNHARIILNLGASLLSRLDVGAWEALVAEGGVATGDGAVRYPDALVAAATGARDDRLIPGVIAVFDVVSPSSARIDRLLKPRDYRSVPSIRRYVIVEQGCIGLTNLYREPGVADWTATTLTAEDTLVMPEVGIQLPVRDIYAGTDVPDAEPDGTGSAA